MPPGSCRACLGALLAFSVAFFWLVLVTIGGGEHNFLAGHIMLQTRMHRAKEIFIEKQGTQSSWTLAIKEKGHFDYDGRNLTYPARRIAAYPPPRLRRKVMILKLD